MNPSAARESSNEPSYFNSALIENYIGMACNSHVRSIFGNNLLRQIGYIVCNY